MVVDSFLRHWVTVLAVAEEGVPPRAASMEVFKRDVQIFLAYLYADDSVVAPMQVIRLQRYFDTLIDSFDHVGLCTNMDKTVIMACHPCRALGGHSMGAYRLRMTVEVHYFRYRLRLRVRCTDCDLDLTTG